MTNKIDNITCLEIYVILTELQLFEKLPKEIQRYIINTKSNDHIFVFEKNMPIQFQTVNKNTMVVLSYLYLKYINENSEVKRKLLDKYKNNKIQYQEELRKKYNPEDLFKNKKESKPEETSLVEVKKWYEKMRLLKKKIWSIVKKKYIRMFF